MKLYNYFVGSSNKMQFLFVFTAAFIVRLLACTFLIETRGTLTSADAADYIQYAHYILNQGIFVLNIEGLSAHAGPGYPFIIALNFLIAGVNAYWFVLFVNVLFSAMAVATVFLIAKEIFSTGWTLVTTLWMMFYIPQIWEVQFLGKESLVFGLFSICIYAIIKICKMQTFRSEWILCFSISYTYLIHSDERYFFYLPFLLLFLLIFIKEFKVKIKSLGLILLLILLFMIPWLYRNYLVFDRLVILTERTAPFTDRILGYNEPPNTYRKFYFEPGTISGNAYYLSAADSISKGLTVTDSRAQPKIITSITEGIANGKLPHANSYMKERISYFKEFWRPFRFKSDFYGTGFTFMERWNLDRWLISLAQYGLLLPLFVIGLIFSFRNMERIPLFLFYIICVHCFIHVFLAHAITRYRLPIDFCIVIIAFYGLRELLKSRRNKFISYDGLSL